MWFVDWTFFHKYHPSTTSSLCRRLRHTVLIFVSAATTVVLIVGVLGGSEMEDERHQIQKQSLVRVRRSPTQESVDRTVQDAQRVVDENQMKTLVQIRRI